MCTWAEAECLEASTVLYLKGKDISHVMPNYLCALQVH